MIENRKKILLITPENKDINNFRKKQFNNFIQITMPYLAGFIDESKYDITLIDEYNQKIPFDLCFDLVAITVNTPNAAHCYDISLKFRTKGAKIVMGGPHVSLLPEEAKSHCDYLIIGEAEETWPVFLEDFYNNTAKSIYKSISPPSLDGLPIPKRNLVKNRFLGKGAVFATRGCPYRCSYCNLKQIYHDCFRTRPVDEVICDIKSIKSRYFVFWDDNFFGDVTYTKDLMQKLKVLNKKWAAQVTLDRCQDEELLKLARQAGCTYLFIGLESFSEISLLSVNKGVNCVEKYRSIVKLLHKHGISVQAGIMFGFDADTKEVFKKTLDACNELGIDGATVSLLTPLPKTPVYDEMEREGRLLTKDWSYYNGKTKVAFMPKNMSAEELFHGYMWFRKRFYSISSIIKRLSVSRTNVFHNFIINIGYKVSLAYYRDERV
ncbi:MAG TPA: radical SAM protein [Clostridia bacterium]